MQLPAALSQIATEAAGVVKQLAGTAAGAACLAHDAAHIASLTAVIKANHGKPDGSAASYRFSCATQALCRAAIAAAEQLSAVHSSSKQHETSWSCVQQLAAALVDVASCCSAASTADRALDCVKAFASLVQAACRNKGASCSSDGVDGHSTTDQQQEQEQQPEQQPGGDE
jgi:hypothetical protein